MTKDLQERVFNTWLRQHKGLLFKVLKAYAFTPEDKADLFQEICLNLWKSTSKFSGKSKESTWIYKVALFSAITWSKKEHKKKITSQSIDVSSNLLTENYEERNDKSEWLYQQIQALNEIDRSLMLLLLDGYSYKEISSILGISESNVGVKINRIKKKITKASTKIRQHEL